MKLSEFILLSEEKKKWTVFYNGVPIAKRQYDHFKVFLFQMDGYYVEAVCNLSSNHIDEYRAFGDTPLLQPYLQGISLDDLFQ